MRKIFIVILMMLLVAGVAYATATKETNDDTARPASIYGKNGTTLTGVQVSAGGAISVSSPVITYNGDYTSQALNSAALSYTTAYSDKTKIKSKPCTPGARSRRR